MSARRGAARPRMFEVAAERLRAYEARKAEREARGAPPPPVAVEYALARLAAREVDRRIRRSGDLVGVEGK